MVISHPKQKEPALDGSSHFADQKTNTVLANKDSPNLLSMFLCQLSELRGIGGIVDSISSLHREKSPVSTDGQTRIKLVKSLVLKQKAVIFSVNLQL